MKAPRNGTASEDNDFSCKINCHTSPQEAFFFSFVGMMTILQVFCESLSKVDNLKHLDETGENV